MVNEAALDAELPNALNSLYESPEIDWTLGIKTALCEVSQRIFPVEIHQAHQDVRGTRFIPHRRHIKTYAGGVDSAGPELLFDVTCLVEDADMDWCIYKTALVGECQWGTWTDIRHDFQKLLVANAEVRVMVFDLSQFKRWTMDRIEFELNAMVGGHEAVDQSHIFVYAGWMPNRFEYRSMYLA